MVTGDAVKAGLEITGEEVAGELVTGREVARIVLVG